MRTVTCQIKTYIQPFERRLAIEELKALAGNPVPIDGTLATASIFKVSGAEPDCLGKNLAYWETVEESASQITSQIRAEVTSIIARNGVSLEDLPSVVPDIIETKRPNKRCLRYASHGVHEYRGKFFPQLVHALMNMAQVPPTGIVLDPMCGSGTTLVEGVLSGRKAYGLDMNPLSVFVTDVKCRILSTEPTSLIKAFRALSKKLSERGKHRGSGYFDSLNAVDQEYLRRWFSRAVLRELDSVVDAIMELRSQVFRDFYRVCLSNILRKVSWQKEDDLRVRKESKHVVKGDVTSLFVEEAMRSTKSVVAYLSHHGRQALGQHAVFEGDARDSLKVLPSLAGEVDAVITSPPYATALPYLDTDRLSLIYLDLLSRNQHRARDALMIGNREITDRLRNAYWSDYEARCDLLPLSTRKLIEKIDRLNKSKQVGFRRRNLSALLAKYFFDMREVLEAQLSLLRPSGAMFMVVGNNRTTAGGEEIEIQTTKHLALIAEGVGFRVAGRLSMEMLASRDIFRKNAMSSEEILTLQGA